MCLFPAAACALALFPPAAPALAPAPGATADAAVEQPATLRLLARIDGSERVHLTAAGARWEHVSAAPPTGSVLLNDVAWDPSRAPALANAEPQRFLDADVDLASAELRVLHGRGTAALERTAAGVTLFVCDSLPGSDLYELELRFRRRDPRRELLIEAVIDGADELYISLEGARWVHRHWSWPPAPVRINGRTWDPREHAFLANGGPRAFLPPEVDLGSFEVVERSGRDLAAVEATDDGLVIRFADDPPGAGTYRLRVRLGLRERAQPVGALGAW